MRKQIEIAAKMYNCQSTVKRFYKDDYEAEIKPYVQVIKGYMNQHNCNEIMAALKLCEDEVIGSHGWTVAKIMAAAVEIAEPA